MRIYKKYQESDVDWKKVNKQMYSHPKISSFLSDLMDVTTAMGREKYDKAVKLLDKLYRTEQEMASTYKGRRIHQPIITPMFRKLLARIEYRHKNPWDYPEDDPSRE